MLPYPHLDNRIAHTVSSYKAFVDTFCGVAGNGDIAGVCAAVNRKKHTVKSGVLDDIVSDGYVFSLTKLAKSCNAVNDVVSDGDLLCSGYKGRVRRSAATIDTYITS